MKEETAGSWRLGGGVGVGGLVGSRWGVGGGVGHLLILLSCTARVRFNRVCDSEEEGRCDVSINL